MHAGGLLQDHLKEAGRDEAGTGDRAGGEHEEAWRCLEGLKLLLVQPVDENGKDAGAAIVAFDTVRAGVGDRVFFEGGKEAAQANPNGWFNPADAAIIGIVDCGGPWARAPGAGS